jgi:hypothetical protein
MGEKHWQVIATLHFDYYVKTKYKEQLDSRLPGSHIDPVTGGRHGRPDRQEPDTLNTRSRRNIVAQIEQAMNKNIPDPVLRPTPISMSATTTATTPQRHHADYIARRRRKRQRR